MIIRQHETAFVHHMSTQKDAIKKSWEKKHRNNRMECHKMVIWYCLWYCHKHSAARSIESVIWKKKEILYIIYACLALLNDGSRGRGQMKKCCTLKTHFFPWPRSTHTHTHTHSFDSHSMCVWLCGKSFFRCFLSRFFPVRRCCVTVYPFRPFVSCVRLMNAYHLHVYPNVPIYYWKEERIDA